MSCGGFSEAIFREGYGFRRAILGGLFFVFCVRVFFGF